MTDYVVGEEICWRPHAYGRKPKTGARWRRGFIVGKRNQWVIVRLRNGDEIEVHPRDIKPVD